jgi:mitochondrial fission protein ELM1
MRFKKFAGALDIVCEQLGNIPVHVRPELVLTVGRRPAMAAQWIRKQSGAELTDLTFPCPGGIATV